MPGVSSRIHAPGFDTWLARLLLERRRLDVETLQKALAQTRLERRQGGTLAATLVRSGLLSPEESDLLLREASSAVAPPGASQGQGPARRAGATAAWTAPGRASAQEETTPGWSADPGQGSAQGVWQEGARVGAYRIVGTLGAGGMGVVYRALHLETGGAYALKTLLPGADADLVERFRREGEAQARVDAHPGVVSVHALEVWEGRLCLVMDLAEGGDLAGRLKRGPLPPREAAQIARDLALGLAHTHAQGVLHRDLKPANVLFDAAGTPKLVDFGLAHLAGAQTLTQTGTILGTPSYMAPEQAMAAERVGPAADVYGLGALLYATLTGRPPFQKGSVMATLIAIREEAPAPPSALAPELDSSLEAICLRCLAKDPQDRYPSAQALAAALTGYLEGERAGARRSLRAPLAAASLLAILLLGAAGVYASRGEGQPGATAATQTPDPALAAASAGDAADRACRNAPRSVRTAPPPSAQPPDQAEYDAAKRWFEEEAAKPSSAMRRGYEAGWYRSLALQVGSGSRSVTPMSYRLSRELHREAAKRGSVASMLDLARMLRSGLGGLPGAAASDRREALTWAIRGLEFDSVGVLDLLFAHYLEGGRSADTALALELARQFVERAGPADFVPARIALARALLSSPPPPWERIEELCEEALAPPTDSPPLPLAPAYRRTLEGLRKQARQGMLLAPRGGAALPPPPSRAARAEALYDQVRTARARGRVKADALAPEGEPSKVRLKLLLAARLRHAQAMFEVAGMLRAGVGAAANPTCALAWYERAVEAGVARAKLPLGEMTWVGEGFLPGEEADPIRGRRLLEEVIAGADDALAQRARETLARLEARKP